MFQAPSSVFPLPGLGGGGGKGGNGGNVLAGGLGLAGLAGIHLATGGGGGGSNGSDGHDSDRNKLDARKFTPEEIGNPIEELTPEERRAIEAKQDGFPYDPAAYKSGKRKIEKYQKYIDARGKGQAKRTTKAKVTPMKDPDTLRYQCYHFALANRNLPKLFREIADRIEREDDFVLQDIVVTMEDDQGDAVATVYYRLRSGDDLRP